MNLEEIDAFLSRPDNSLSIVKIGLELFVKYGADLVHKIQRDYKKKIFLDLKLHDIPITVERAIHSLKNLPIEFLTIHLAGGEEMIKCAISSARISIPNCKILGVSFLTSLSDHDLKTLFGITNSTEAFERLFNIAHKAHIDGVICSPHELTPVKKQYPKLLAITPGIRFLDEIQNNVVQDQKRIATPDSAIALGADYIVIGRSLTQSENLASRIDQLSV